MLIENSDMLRELVADLRSRGSCALDTEFIREKTYRPELCLIQLATPDDVFIVDPFLVGELDGLLELMRDDSVEKIVHAGEQDMEIFFALNRELPRNVFDTQVAAALAGQGDSISYARLVDELLGVQLEKVETFTDWGKRPLTQRQVEYALNDVRYLYPLKNELSKRLEELGRLEWLSEELQFFEERSLYERDPEKLYRKMKGAAKLTPPKLVVLRELVAWREEEAERKNWPRGRVISDAALIELARREPSTIDEVALVRTVHPQLVNRSGREIITRVARARKVPASEHPPAIRKRSGDPELALVVDLLEVVLRSRAANAQIAPGYLGTRKELLELARRHLHGDGDGEHSAATRALPLLSGWRKRLAGDALVALLQGRSRVAIDAATARVEEV